MAIIIYELVNYFYHATKLQFGSFTVLFTYFVSLDRFAGIN